MKQIKLYLFIFAVFDCLVWYAVFASLPNTDLKLYFLNVGQGDSQFVVLPHGVKFMIDGGSANNVLAELPKALTSFDRYIDFLIVTHTDLDHLTGLIGVLKNYEVGAVVYNGKGSDSPELREFSRLLIERHTPVVVLGEGDTISYNGSVLHILSPGLEVFSSAAPNDSAIVMELESKNSKTLFTSDIAFLTEDIILKRYDLDIDILKVAHHGSRFATSKEFLAEATPKVSVIQVGKNNYGHPTPQTLQNLKESDTTLYRNDLDGTIELVVDGKSIKVFKGL